MADVIDTLAIDIVANDQFSSVAQRILNVLENMERQLAQTTKQVSENEAELQSLQGGITGLIFCLMGKCWANLKHPCYLTDNPPLLADTTPKAQ